MDSEVQENLSKLTLAVEAMMNNATQHQQRLEAYQACESFKENSPHCAQCGVLMASKDQNQFIRHFGLQLLEHCVKYRWNKITADEKVFIKNNTMKLISEGTLDILNEKAHIKDGLSRIIVEMIKREWPQQWPSLMEELNNLCLLGPTQTELVLLIFLRLAEDVIAFQTLPNQRRREVVNALTSNMTDIYSFFITTLQSNMKQYTDGKTSSAGNPEQQAIACQVAKTLLLTLQGYVDWINMNFIIDQNGMLLEMFCVMLSDPNLQLGAAECLLLITSRKGKLEDRKPLLILFSEGAMSTILQAARTAAMADLEEYHYRFLKTLCQVLVAIGNQLGALWGAIDDVKQPPNFVQYLEAIIAFTEHPSQMLGSYTQTLWASFLRHEHISEDPLMLEFLPKIVNTARISLLKVGFPSQTNSRSCAYTSLDFDCDEDFNVFWSKYRAEVAETIRMATNVAPDMTFHYAAEWLQSLLKKPIVKSQGFDKELCKLSSPEFLEWDALSIFLESVMSRLTVTDKPKPHVSEGIQLLKDVLVYNTHDPLILSRLLSCISALFAFITDAPEVLPTVLEKIFSTAVFNLEGQTKSTRSKAVKNVRRHACSVLVKICKQYPDLLMPGFDQLYSHIIQISSDPEELSQMEKCTLMEALILINNRFKNFDKQCSFLGEILKPVNEMWLSQNLQDAIWSTEKFIAYVGLDQPPVEPSSEDISGINRSHIQYCINTILATLKRSTWPENMEAAKGGGFVTGTTETGGSILRNPATSHLIVMLDNVLALIRTLNSLWLKVFLSKRHPDFDKAFDMLEVDKQATLGIHPPFIDNTDAPSCKQPLERMQLFMSTIHDSCYHILGNCGVSMGHQFYQAPSLASSLNNSVFTSLDTIPDYRLRPIIRVFMKPFVQYCPREYHQSAILPVLSTLCPYMLQRLTGKWQVINQHCEEEEEEGQENPESQEVLEEQLIRQLTREYIDFLGAVFREKKSADVGEEQGMDDGDCDGKPTQNNTKDDSVSELGQTILSNDAVYSPLVLTIFNGLTWRDSSVCNKCINLCWPVLKQLLINHKLTSEDACHLYTAILLGLQMHGQHEGSQAMLISLGLQVYENLRPVFPGLVKVMLQVPNCTEHNLKTFDDKLLTSTPQKALPEKRKKDNFKKLVQEIIGKNIGQQFKCDAQIKNLPPMCKASKIKPSIDDLDSKDIGLCALFTQEAK